MRRLLLIFSALLVVGAQATPVQAFPPVVGTCLLGVKIDFTGGKMFSSLHTPSSDPSYSMTVTPLLGGLSCAYELNGFPPIGSTSVTASPDTVGDLWTCEAVLGSGEWDQSWTPDPGSAYFDSTYTITGTWGSWTMLITDSDFVSTVHLTLDPATPTATTQCFDPPVGSGVGVDPLRLVGVQVIGGL